MRPAVPPSSLDPSFLPSLLNCFFAPLKATHVSNFARGGEWQRHRERVRWSSSSDGESDGIERVNKTFYRCRTSSSKHGGAEVHWSLLNIQHCQCNLRAATFSVKCADSCSLEQNHTVQMSCKCASAWTATFTLHSVFLTQIRIWQRWVCVKKPDFTFQSSCYHVTQ